MKIYALMRAEDTDYSSQWGSSTPLYASVNKQKVIDWAEKNFGLEWLEEANDFGMNNRWGEEIMEIEVDND